MITQKDLDRINELYHREKAGTLTQEEAAEQARLRKDYVAAIRASLRGTLESVKIQEPDGSLTDVKARHDKKYPGGVH